MKILSIIGCILLYFIGNFFALRFRTWFRPPKYVIYDAYAKIPQHGVNIFRQFPIKVTWKTKTLILDEWLDWDDLVTVYIWFGMIGSIWAGIINGIKKIAEFIKVKVTNNIYDLYSPALTKELPQPTDPYLISATKEVEELINANH
jgi:hypothetical protein